MVLLGLRPRAILICTAFLLFSVVLLGAWHRQAGLQAAFPYSHEKSTFRDGPIVDDPPSSIEHESVDAHYPTVNDFEGAEDAYDSSVDRTASESSDTSESFRHNLLFDTAAFDDASMKTKVEAMKAAGLDISRVATLVETRDSPRLVSVIHNFLDLLPYHWPIRIYHAVHNRPTLLKEFAEQIESGKITLVLMNESAVVLPTNEAIDASHAIGKDDADEVSSFLKRPEFWENQSPAEHVLMFQLDSVLCSTSRFKIADFFDFDFIGSPISFPPFISDTTNASHWVNGGFSLRRRSCMLEAIRRFGQEVTDLPEDLWFYKKLDQMSAKLPRFEEARLFGVQMFPSPEALGVHQYWNWMEEHEVPSVGFSCPEAKLISPALLEASQSANNYMDVFREGNVMTK